MRDEPWISEALFNISPCPACHVGGGLFKRLYHPIDKTKTIGLKCPNCGNEYFSRDDLFSVGIVERHVERKLFKRRKTSDDVDWKKVFDKIDVKSKKSSVTSEISQTGERLVTFEKHPLLPDQDLSVAIVYKTFKIADGIGVDVLKVLTGEEAEKLYELLL